MRNMSSTSQTSTSTTMLKVSPELQDTLDFVYRTYPDIPSRLKSSLSIFCRPGSNAAVTTASSFIGDSSMEELPLTEEKYEDLYISFNLLKEFSRFMLNHEQKASSDPIRSSYWLHELIKHCKLHIEAPSKVTERSPHLTKQLAECQERLDQAEYNRMISSALPAITPSQRITNSNLEDLKWTRQQIAMAMNVIFSVIGCFFGFLWLLGPVIENVELRLLASLMGAFAVGFAEVWLYIAYFRDSQRTIANFERFNTGSVHVR